VLLSYRDEDYGDLPTTSSPHTLPSMFKSVNLVGTRVACQRERVGFACCRQEHARPLEIQTHNHKRSHSVMCETCIETLRREAIL
jgi:hypothetical protein